MHINLFDSHIHSDNSFDGLEPVTYICERAVENGLSGIAITDHCDINRFEEDQALVRMRQSHFKTRLARDIFKTKLIVALGIEIGQPMENPELAELILADRRYDFVLAGVHNVPGREDYINMNLHEEDPYELLDSYFEELIKTARWGKFDSLAHLCYPLRYFSKEGIEVDMSRYEDAHDEVFKALVHHGKAVELNTAALRWGGAITPTLVHLKRFKELGGEFVTIGSDAHTIDAVGANVRAGMEFLDSAGFEYFAFYRNHQPRMLKVL